MKDIFNIIFRLTLSCILAGLVMGGTYIVTNKAKLHNEHVNEQKVRYALLGFDSNNPPADSISLQTIYRYVITSAKGQFIGYLLPMASGAEAPFSLVVIDLNGDFVEATPLQITPEKAGEKSERDKLVGALLGSKRTARYADQVIVATDNGARIAYLLEGKFQGFKTFINVMLSIDPEFSIMGLEILEHEEDPGLGAEIERDYFRNQFKDKPYEVLKRLAVVKKPMPDEYYNALEGKIDAETASGLLEQYRDQDIYALTGATISSEAVLSGVKGIVRKFVYRLSVLDKVIKEQQLAVAF